MADDFWSGLGGLLGSGTSDLYGDLLTEKQRKALLFKEIGGGLDEISRRAAEAGKPSLMPGGKGWLGSALSGYGAGASAAGEGVLKTLGEAQKIRQMKQQADLNKQISPMILALAQAGIDPKLWGGILKSMPGGGATATPPAGVPPAPAGMPAAPLTPTAPPGAAPAAGGPAGVPTPPPGPGYTGPTNEELGAPPVSMGLPQAGMSPFGMPNAPTQLGNQTLPAPGATRPGGLPRRIGYSSNAPDAVMIDLDTGQPIQASPGGAIRPPPGAPRQQNTGLLGDGSPYAQLASFPGSGPLGGSGGGGYGDNPFAGVGALAAAGGDEPTGGPDVVIPSGPRLQRSDLTNVAAAGGDDWQRVKPLIRKYESGGRNIEQGVVGPQGGYNPSTGTVTGPSSASGYYQMIDPTWRAAARKAGIDTDKYPRAINAPEELQDRAAEALYREQGLKPWAPYNSRLAAATGYRGGGQDTVIPSGRGIPASALTNVADTGAAPPAGAAPGGGYIPGLGITPQGLAALNALTKMGGLGEPFGSLLETYYKSPNYLTEAARARALGENDPLIIEQKKRTEYKIDTELKPGLEAAVAAAMNAPLNERAKAQAEIDRRTKELEQLGAAGTKIEKATVVGDDGKPVLKDMTALEIAIREKLTIQRRAAGDTTAKPGDIIGTPVLSPGETTGQQEAAKLPYTSKKIELTWPDGETRELEVTGQQAKDIAEGKPVPAIGWPGTAGGGAVGDAAAAGTAGTGARVGKTVYPPGYAEATTVMLKERRPKAEAAVQSLNFNETAQRLLDAGIISGWGANIRLDAAKAKAYFGWSNDQIANTEAFLATQTRQTASVLASGAFGSGSSITEEDRRQAARMVGADSTLDEKSLRFLIRLNATAANWEIDRYKADVKRHDPRGQLPILDIMVPERAQAKPSANQPKIINSQQLNGKTYHRWSDGKWRVEGELPGEEK